MENYVLFSQYLISCRIRGEYCLYSIVANDAGLLSWFNKESSKEAKEWYDIKVEKILTIQKSLLNSTQSLREGEYEYINNQFLSEFSIQENEGKKSAVLMFWRNYGDSSSDEEFFFEWESNKWEYEVLGNRSGKKFLLKFEPTEEGVMIKVICQEGIYYSWESGQESEEWINAEYKYIFET